MFLPQAITMSSLSIGLSLLVLAMSVPCGTGFNLMPGLGRPTFGAQNVAARCRAGRASVLVQGVSDKQSPQFGMALMDPPGPPHAKDEAEKREYELNRGQAVDTLLIDYPAIFLRSPDLSIFHQNILLRDTQGFSLEGLRAYKAFFSVVPTLGNVAFSRCEVSALLMDKYGIDKSRIKIRFFNQCLSLFFFWSRQASS
jgi:hypothetical protein